MTRTEREIVRRITNEILGGLKRRAEAEETTQVGKRAKCNHLNLTWHMTGLDGSEWLSKWHKFLEGIHRLTKSKNNYIPVCFMGSRKIFLFSCFQLFSSEHTSKRRADGCYNTND